MIQGAYQNLDISIDDYTNLSCLKLSTKLQVPNVVHPDLELSRTSPIDKNTNDNLDDDHQTKTCSMTEFQENKDCEDKDTMSEISLDSETYEEVIKRIAGNYLDTQLENFIKKLDANQEQHLKDIQAQFTNRLKHKKRYFEDEITETIEAYKIKIETLSNTVNKLNSEISNLKGQLKIQTKQHDDMKTLLLLKVKRHTMMVINPSHLN